MISTITDVAIAGRGEERADRRRRGPRIAIMTVPPAKITA